MSGDGVQRFVITTAAGETYEGVVHGSGGVLGRYRDALEMLRREIRRATRGRPLSIYEPEPGHAKLYLNYSASGVDEKWVAVDLRGAIADLAVERVPLMVGDEAWWFGTEPVGTGAAKRRKFVGAARVRLLCVDDVEPDAYHVEILIAIGASLEIAREQGIEPVVHRRDLYATTGHEHAAFGAMLALAGVK